MNSYVSRTPCGDGGRCERSSNEKQINNNNHGEKKKSKKKKKKKGVKNTKVKYIHAIIIPLPIILLSCFLEWRIIIIIMIIIETGYNYYVYSVLKQKPVNFHGRNYYLLSCDCCSQEVGRYPAHTTHLRRRAYTKVIKWLAQSEGTTYIIIFGILFLRRTFEWHDGGGGGGGLLNTPQLKFSRKKIQLLKLKRYTRGGELNAF